MNKSIVIGLGVAITISLAGAYVAVYDKFVNESFECISFAQMEATSVT